MWGPRGGAPQRCESTVQSGPGRGLTKQGVDPLAPVSHRPRGAPEVLVAQRFRAVPQADRAPSESRGQMLRGVCR